MLFNFLLKIEICFYRELNLVTMKQTSKKQQQEAALFLEAVF